VRARADVTAAKGGVPLPSFSVPMRAVGGGLHRAVIQPAASPAGTSPSGRVGLDVTWSVHATDPAGNASDSAPATFRVCGAEAYGVGAPNSTGQRATIAGIGEPALGTNAFAASVSGLPAGQAAQLVVGTVKIEPWARWRNGVPAYAEGAIATVANVTADGSGQATVSIDFTQAPFVGVSPGQFRYLELRYQEGPRANASNGLELVFCD
jgi:hypothetical protein